MSSALQKIECCVVIFTKNEENNIAECIQSIDRQLPVFVIDSMSTDQTRSVAKSFGAEVIEFKWNGQLPKKREWTLRHLESITKWILFLDADERATSDLLRDVIHFVSIHSEDQVRAAEIKIDYVFQGKKLKFGHKVSKRVLLRTEYCEFPNVEDTHISGMGELEGHFQPNCDGKTGKIKSRILHQDQDPLEDWISRHNRYSTWESGIRSRQDLRMQIRSNKSRAGKLFDLFPNKPLLFFIRSFFVKLGFLDGIEGFDYALGLSFYYWQIDAKMRDPNNSNLHSQSARNLTGSNG